jgi:hypothetical protein
MPLAVDFQGGISSAWSNVITFVPKLAAALVIILVGYLIAKVVASVLNKVLERVGFDRAVERGGIKTMQRYWERAASRAERRGPELRQQARASAPSTPTDGYEHTQTYEPQSGGAVGAVIDPGATEEFGTGRTRRRGR